MPDDLQELLKELTALRINLLKSIDRINSIENIGFESTANLYSISDTAKFSGKVGWIQEDQLSKTIKKEIEAI